MNECWAHELGNCSDKLSREHTVSAGLFPSGKVLVQGFPWCPQFKEIGVPSLTRKILCEKHNNDLSDVDAGAIAAAEEFRKFVNLQTTRTAMRERRWAKVIFPMNGTLLERWCLKTLINVAFEKPNRIGTDSVADGRPSKRLVEVAYGIQQFNPRAGLYGLGYPGLTLKFMEQIQLISVLDAGNVCVGAAVVFHGFPFFLHLEEKGLQSSVHIPRLAVLLEQTTDQPHVPHYHLKHFKTKIGRYDSHEILLTWT